MPRHVVLVLRVLFVSFSPFRLFILETNDEERPPRFSVWYVRMSAVEADVQSTVNQTEEISPPFREKSSETAYRFRRFLFRLFSSSLSLSLSLSVFLFFFSFR